MVLFLRGRLLEEEDKEEVLESDLGGLEWSIVTSAGGRILKRIAIGVGGGTNYKS